MMAGPRKRSSHSSSGLILLATLVLCGMADRSHAGAFMFAGEGEENNITHPTGYSGTGGHLTVSVCVLDTSPDANQMLIPVANAARRWTHLVATDRNLRFGNDNTIPFTDFDLESAVMHEMGHCIGLGHPNLGSQVSGSDSEYTNSTDGENNTWDFDAGLDGVKGSSDNVRGDDGNLHWFFTSSNNPFTMQYPVDSTTYSRDLGALPGGHTFAANAGRDVGVLLGFPDTEAVLQQGQPNDEAQRRLCADDVATFSYAMTGVDELAGTSDDYTVEFVFTGLQSDCDIVVAFDDGETGFAVCQIGGSGLSPSHWKITAANIFYNTGFNWHFNQRPNCDENISGDYGDDDRSDLLLRNQVNGRTYLYEMDGRSIKDAGMVREVTVNTAWEIVGTADYNGDGQSDIYIRKNTSGKSFIYLLEGRNIIGEGNVPITTNLNWVVVGSGDFNNDGRADVLLRNQTNGLTHMYMLDGYGIVDEGRVEGAFTSLDWAVEDVADMNNDGRADILLRNQVNGKFYVYLMDGRTIVSQGLLDGVTTNLDWQVIGLGHFDRDCRADLALRNQVNGRTYLYFLDGTTILAQGRIKEVTTNLGWTAIHIGDYNGDGLADLFLRKEPAGNSYMYLLDGTTILEQGKVAGITTNLAWDVVGP